jgi:iron(III) transport system ATP-binding protein
MTELSVHGLHKAFGAQPVLRGVDLEVPAGSLTAILGPSGSGKTTLLRVLVGFERADRGTVALGGRVVDDGGERFVPPEHRGVGYVPQEGALFPHLNVGRNIAFGLSKAVRRDGRVGELLTMVGLKGLHRRYPHELSGGQQQRVALARALAIRPAVVLLDEPFSSLDATLRASVRADVADVLRRSRTTALLVTHDQDEALSMADHVAVIRDGVVGQVDSPEALYAHPQDPGLARFLGEANLLPATVRAGTAETPLGVLAVTGAVPEGRATVLVRPEQLDPGPAGAGGPTAEVVAYEFYGHDAVVRLRPEGTGGPGELVARVTGGSALRPGDRVGLTVRGPVVAWAGEKGQNDAGITTPV